MKKTLVCVNNLDNYIPKNCNTFHVNSSIILTPSAKDELASRGISVVYDTCNNSNSSGSCNTIQVPTWDNPKVERLFYAVAAILKSEYGINDPETLKNLSCQILKTLKENI